MPSTVLSALMVSLPKPHNNPLRQVLLLAGALMCQRWSWYQAWPEFRISVATTNRIPQPYSDYHLFKTPEGKIKVQDKVDPHSTDEETEAHQV